MVKVKNMEIIKTNNYQFNLIKKEDETITYLSNKVEEKFKDRPQFEKFASPLLCDVGHTINTNNKGATMVVSIEYDDNKNFIDYLQYNITFKENKKLLTIDRLSPGKRWRIKYKYFKIKINITLIN